MVVMATAALCASTLVEPRVGTISGMAAAKASIFMRRPITPAIRPCGISMPSCTALVLMHQLHITSSTGQVKHALSPCTVHHTQCMQQNMQTASSRSYGMQGPVVTTLCRCVCTYAGIPDASAVAMLGFWPASFLTHPWTAAGPHRG